MSSLKFVVARFKTWRAFLTNNRKGKQFDVHGRSYRSVYKRFGSDLMTHDYLHGNSWKVR